MKSKIKNLVIIGCSLGGKHPCGELVSKIKLNSSAAIIVPHVENNTIYTNLVNVKGLEFNIAGIDSRTIIEQGNVYVLGHHYENIRYLHSSFKFDNGSIKFYDKDNEVVVNEVMESAAYSYLERCNSK